MKEIFVSKELKIPDEVLAFFNSKHESLQNDYSVPGGCRKDACLLVASDLAKLLLKNGRKPALMRVDPADEHGDVIPKVFAGRVKWGAHVICVCDGLVFDPMLSAPVLLAEYEKTVFKDSIVIKELLFAEEVSGH